MKQLKTLLPRLRHFLRDKNRKSYFLILRDVLVLTIRKRGFPFYYFGRMVYRRDAGDCRNYFSTREYYSVINSERFNQPEFNCIMQNKLMLSFFCKEFNIPAAKLLAHNFRTTFYTSAQAIKLTTNEQLVGFFKTLALSNRTESIFVKPQMGKGGKGAFLLHMSTLKEQLEVHGDDLRSGFYVFQETIVQHPEISRIYPHSINTLRISTYRDGEGNLHTLPTVMRFGIDGNVVDNRSSGGLYIIVDRDQGSLRSVARTELATGSTDFIKHPDTGILFANYKIPYFREAHTFCEQLATLLPNRFTGWDVAIALEGPILVEANANPNLTLGELEHGGYLQYPVYQKILDEK